MARQKQPDYTDSEGVRHSIEQDGYIQNTLHTGGHGASSDFVSTGVYIDGKRWAGFDEMGMAGDPNKLAEAEIERRSKDRIPPPP